MPFLPFEVVAYEPDVELEVVHVCPHPEEGSAPGRVAEGCEQAGQHRHLVSLGVGLYGPDDLAGQPAQSFLGELRPGRGVGDERDVGVRLALSARRVGPDEGR
jgi:hypothetical protein